MRLLRLIHEYLLFDTRIPPILLTIHDILRRREVILCEGGAHYASVSRRPRRRLHRYLHNTTTTSDESR
jgi:hypothetical protein